MPRRSQDSLMLVHPRVDGRPNRIGPPEQLTGEQCRLFIAVVSSMPPEHFRPCDIPLLSVFVEALSMCERAVREMEATGGPVLGDGINPWFSVQQRAAKQVATLSTRLRMSPQSRRGPKTVHRAGYQPPSAYDTMNFDDDNAS
jgi:phage terminase small subunit